MQQCVCVWMNGKYIYLLWLKFFTRIDSDIQFFENQRYFRFITDIDHGSSTAQIIPWNIDEQFSSICQKKR